MALYLLHFWLWNITFEVKYVLIWILKIIQIYKNYWFRNNSKISVRESNFSSCQSNSCLISQNTYKNRAFRLSLSPLTLHANGGIRTRFLPRARDSSSILLALFSPSLSYRRPVSHYIGINRYFSSLYTSPQLTPFRVGCKENSAAVLIASLRTRKNMPFFRDLGKV